MKYIILFIIFIIILTKINKLISNLIILKRGNLNDLNARKTTQESSTKRKTKGSDTDYIDYEIVQ